MISTPANTRHRGIPRMLAATIALTFLYIALQEVFVAVNSAIESRQWLPAPFQRGLEQQARHVAQESSAREAQLTPEHQLAAWALGLRLGGAAQILGSFALAQPA